MMVMKIERYFGAADSVQARRLPRAPLRGRHRLVLVPDIAGTILLIYSQLCQSNKYNNHGNVDWEEFYGVMEIVFNIDIPLIESL
jgi:hypothetical protein